MHPEALLYRHTRLGSRSWLHVSMARPCPFFARTVTMVRSLAAVSPSTTSSRLHLFGHVQ